MKRTTTYLLMVLTMTLFIFTGITPAFSSPSGDTVRIFVEYANGHKNAVGNALKATKARFHYEFDELNSFVVTVPTAAVNGIQRNPHVAGIEEDVPRYPIASTPAKAIAPAVDIIEDSGQTIPYGIDAVQARDVWDTDRDAVVDDGAPTGAGITVCIIDTGYYSAHEDLASVNTVGGHSQVDDNSEDWTTDGYGHGTHVAGTISAANNSVGVVGVTPGTVDFYIIKYFNDDGDATMASDLIDAINRCADSGAHVINMSLGGTRSVRREQRAFDSIYADGILSIAAAGNDGNDAYSYPASYDSVMSVAAIDEALEIADFSQQNDQVEIAAPGVAVLSTLPYIDESSLTAGGVEYEANHIEFSARSEDEVISGALVDGGLCSTTGDWAGKVVLCERGDISFYDKVMNVENSGGAAAVIYNNESGNFFGTLDVGNSSDIIGISLSQEDGLYLVGMANEPNTTTYGTVSSIFDWPASGYQAWDGTSMATPHVAGVAALIWSADETLTNVDIRDAMNATALELGEPGLDDAYGHGLVQAYDALDELGLAPVPVDSPPVVSITSPDDGKSFESGTTVDFAGTASDIEDGDVTADIVWSSNVDGEIGTGGSPSAVLSDGDHIITASVTDSVGNTASDSITVIVTDGGTLSSLDVLITTDSVYFNRDRTNIRVTVTDASTGDPVADASVAWTIAFPDLEANGAATTDINGVATISYRINIRKTGTGTATLDVSVTADGYEDLDAEPVTFTVE